VIKVLNVMLRIQKDKQVDIGKTSFLELNGMNMSFSSTKVLKLWTNTICIFLMILIFLH